MYELVCEVVGHQGDVRAICAAHGGMFVSGSRDRFAKIWQPLDNAKAYDEKKTLFDHEHWVSTLLTLPNNAGFVTGCQDKKIRWYSDDGKLQAVITGHEGPVSSLAWSTKNDLLVSGSWDGTCRTWRLDEDKKSFENVSILPGHENGVCVLALDNGDIVTGSAGVQEGNRITGFQIRVWRDGQVIRTMMNHTGAIRSLCMAAADGSRFASTSNDGTVKIWSTESGELLSSMSNPPGPEGTPAFNFCVSSLNNYSQVIVASDDCSARIWNDDGIIAEEIQHPCTVWCVTQLENGDIVTGGSDGVVRVFSTDPGRKAEPSIIQYYLEQTEKTRKAIANKSSNGGNAVDPTKLPKIYDAKPGTSDGQVKMFNKNGEAWVFQWSNVSQTWVEVGEVMGETAKEQLDGEEYDKVIPVELEDPASGGVRSLKLGFNQGDNPFAVAQRFVEKNGLSENHVQEIADFINNVRGQSSAVPMIDMSGGGGGGGGTTAASSSSAPMEIDFSNGPFPLPSCTGLVFDSVKLDKVLGKLLEVNASLGDSSEALSEEEASSIRSMVEVLRNTSRYHASLIDTKSLAALKKVLRWSAVENVFPALDLLRILLTHPDGAEKICSGPSGQAVLTGVLALSQSCSELAIALLAARVTANYFRRRAGVELVTSVLESENGYSNLVEPLVSLGDFPNKNVRSAVATALLNCSNGVNHLQKVIDEQVKNGLIEGSLHVGSLCVEQGENESVRRCLLAIGCLALMPDYAAGDEQYDAIFKLVNAVSDQPEITGHLSKVLKAKNKK